VEIVVDSVPASHVRDRDKPGRPARPVATSRGVIEVTEVTRNGEPVRSGRFMAERVVALVEHPAPPPTRGRRVLRGQTQL
jgi:hypothetical protein